ncbi:MAG: sigma-54 dependent transcriptional regulator [Thermodesulfobacteriota bacterium]|nr:sigma-54 dependent transcriptional regulator [Thermodesulfobacteriota bacterium]
MESLKILVVDDEAPLREILQRGLAQMGGFSVEVAQNGQEAIEKVEKDIFDLILTDLMMPEMNGMELLKIVKATRPEMPVIMMTAYGSIDTAIEAMKIGANDYITKPVDLRDLLLRISKVHQESRLLQENRLLRMEVRKKFEFANIIGKSRKMQEVFSLIEKVAPSNSTVIIYGGSGTGKELVAKAIHYHSLRADYPFIPFNCGAIPETLVESELFGHTKGAFTGAVQTKKGLFEEAHEGTLFLDEISTVLPSVQVKLLRVLQEREVMKIGSTERTKIDVRMIAATNEDLEANMRKGKFREDLYYRLHVFPISLPDLKDRRDDIPLLTYHFLDLYSKEAKKQIKGISIESMNLLLEYDWPGNVRELENTIERAVIMAEGEFLTPQDFPKDLVQGLSILIRRGARDRKSLDELKAEYINQILKDTDGNKKTAAEILKVNLRTLYRFEKKRPAREPF